MAAKKKKTVAKPKTERSTAKGDSAHSHTGATEPAIPYERGIFRGSSRVDSHNARAVFYLENEDREVETIEPIERIRDLELGAECGILVRDASGRASSTFLAKILSIYGDSYEIQHVVFKRKLQTKEFGRLAVFKRASGDDVAVAVPAQDLDCLSAGDVCQVIFFNDTEELVGGVKATLMIGDVPLDSRANFLQVVRKTRSVEDGDVLLSLQQLPTPVLEEIPTEPLHRERESVPTADEILADIAAAQEPIIEKLNRWLASLEGRTLSSEQASSFAAHVRHIVARAGCELVFCDRPVTLVAMTSGRKTASLHLKTLRSSPVETIHSSQHLPALSVQPIEGP